MYMCSSYVPVLPLPRSVSRWDSYCGRGGTGLQVHHRHAAICQPPRQEGLLWKGRQHSVFRDGCMVCCASYRFLVMWGLRPWEPKILGMGNQYNFTECTFLWYHIACFVGSNWKSRNVSFQHQANTQMLISPQLGSITDCFNKSCSLLIPCYLSLPLSMNLCLYLQSDPFFEISKSQEGGGFTVVHRSDPIFKTLDPRYS